MNGDTAGDGAAGFLIQICKSTCRLLASALVLIVALSVELQAPLPRAAMCQIQFHSACFAHASMEVKLMHSQVQAQACFNLEFWIGNTVFKCRLDFAANTISF